MPNDTFRHTPRKAIAPEELDNAPQQNDPLQDVRRIQEAIASETGQESEVLQSPVMNNNNPDVPFKISGRIPEELQRTLQNRGAQSNEPRAVAQPRRPASELRVKPGTGGGSEELEDLLAKLADQNTWEEIELPSKGKFYDSIPEVLHIRSMTGEEEQILAQPRYVRKGKAIDMIFEKCIREPINPADLLSVDRTYLLIYLRGISYTPEYDVEIKCPSCSQSFNHVIDLDQIEVDGCPADFSQENLNGVLPTSGFRYGYRLATGDDELSVTRYRENRLQNFEQSDDDTLLYRTALLLTYIEGVKDRHELSILLKRLPINDVAHLRNVINDPPFGVNTDIGIICPNCANEFKIDLPLEANFFFPRKKTDRTQV